MEVMFTYDVGGASIIVAWEDLGRHFLLGFGTGGTSTEVASGVWRGYGLTVVNCVTPSSSLC